MRASALVAREAVVIGQRRDRVGNRLRQVDVGRGDDLVDHALQAELLPVLRREDPRDAVVVQLLDLARDDDAAAAAEHLDVAGAALAQQVEHVLEELDVPALVRRDRDAVRVLLDRAVDDLLDRAVVPEMDHLAARRLQDPPHDVDRRVVAVEQARRRDEAHLGDRLVDERLAGGRSVMRGPREGALCCLGVLVPRPISSRTCRESFKAYRKPRCTATLRARAGFQTPYMTFT